MTAGSINGKGKTMTEILFTVEDALKAVKHRAENNCVYL